MNLILFFAAGASADLLDLIRSFLPVDLFCPSLPRSLVPIETSVGALDFPRGLESWLGDLSFHREQA